MPREFTLCEVQSVPIEDIVTPVFSSNLAAYSKGELLTLHRAVTNYHVFPIQITRDFRLIAGQGTLSESKRRGDLAIMAAIVPDDLY